MAIASAKCTCKKCGDYFWKETRKMNCREATSWEEWARKNFDICPQCEYEARAAKAAELAQKAAAEGLPQLQGSQKQVVWAEQIRAELLEDARNCLLKNREYIEKHESDVTKREEKLHIIDIYEEILGQIQRKSYAAWWIDNRYHSGPHLMQQMYREQRLKELEV